MLAVDVDRSASGRRRSWRALNEAVIEKRETGHTVRLARAHRRRRPSPRYAADGLIVATPTARRPTRCRRGARSSRPGTGRCC